MYNSTIEISTKNEPKQQNNHLNSIKRTRHIHMKKLWFLLLALVLLASCADSYNITGSSNISTLDGRKLYLKVFTDNDFKKIDSCEVVHGAFSFSGKLDSVCMANLFMDDESLLPLVLEEGNIAVTFNTTKQTVGGTPLNDKLFQFFSRYNQLKNQEVELVRKHDQAIMNGKDMEEVVVALQNTAAQLAQQEDNLVTSFVTNNFDNVLGPGIFFMVTIGQEHPELTPWVEDIMSKATDRFKNDPYVKDYYQKAQENQEIVNGLKDSGYMGSAPVETATPASPVPTPNELAKPAQ